MILGIDEVGRGPWAGPLVIGAVVLGNPQDQLWAGLNDSKKLSAKRREVQNQNILENAEATGLGWVSAAELDQIGLSLALQLATMRAICELLKMERPKNATDFCKLLIKKSNLPFTEIIIDGTVNFLRDTPLENLATTLPKADSIIKEVSAASIIAKVARDSYMGELSKKYPEYGFDRHVGYGTAKHKAALEKYGPCPEHRKIFKPVAEKTNYATAGQKAEAVVASYLKSQGHKILARNHKTRFYEIDIISVTKEHIYFTEVKYRKNSKHGEPLEFIDAKKQKRMTFAAEAFLKLFSQKSHCQPDDLPLPVLAAASVSGKNFHLDQWFTIED